MLHDRTIKTDIIKNIQTKTEEICTLLHTETIFFNERIHTYVGVKLHHGYTFFTSDGGNITYPRGVHGKTVENIYRTLKEKKVYATKTQDGHIYKIKPKKDK